MIDLSFSTIILLNLYSTWNLRRVLPLQGFNLIAPDAETSLIYRQALFELLINIFCKEVARIHAESEQYLSKLIEKTKNPQLVNNPHLESILATWRQTIDRVMHLQIYNEVVDCLAQKKHRPVLQNLVVLGLYNFTLVSVIAYEQNLLLPERLRTFNSFHNSNVDLSEETIRTIFSRMYQFVVTGNKAAIEAIASFVRDDILEVLALTPWAEGFTRQLEILQ